MGLTIVLEGENGNEIESIDDNDLLQSIIPDYNDKGSYCLRFVDLYGDTTFNNLQIPELISELEQKLRDTKSNTTKDLIENILRLSHKCQNEVHLYLKFYGD
jgi:ABC-type iron transport system FetAB ATPase subunit